MLAMSCDYRVMASGYVIGMNETKFGLVAPPFFISTLVNTVGQRKAELLLTKGTLVSTSDALKLGMIDEEVAEEEVMAAAEREMLALISVNEEVGSFLNPTRPHLASMPSASRCHGPCRHSAGRM